MTWAIGGLTAAKWAPTSSGVCHRGAREEEDPAQRASASDNQTPACRLISLTYQAWNSFGRIQVSLCHTLCHLRHSRLIVIIFNVVLRHLVNTPGPVGCNASLLALAYRGAVILVFTLLQTKIGQVQDEVMKLNDSEIPLCHLMLANLFTQPCCNSSHCWRV